MPPDVIQGVKLFVYATMEGMLMAMKNDRKPCFQGLHAGLVSKALAAALAVAALQLTVCADACLAEVLEGAVELKTHDPDAALNSLTTNAKNGWDGSNAENGWKGANTISEANKDKIYYVPSGKTARASDATQTIVPTIYCSGCIYPRASGSKVTTFNDLCLMDGGYIDGRQIGPKGGKITILAEEPENPAYLVYNRDDVWKYTFKFCATVIGSKDAHLLYKTANGGLAMLSLTSGSDWSGFEGTLHIADGVGIANESGVPIAMPGSVEFGNGGILCMDKGNAPYSFGNLSFVEGGAITNTGSGATLTVSGTFDTGTNCDWRCLTVSTFGTLVLGDGLNWHNDKDATDITGLGAALLNVTNRLVVGKNVTFEFAGISGASNGKKVLLMKLSPEAVAAGGFDLSGVAVSFSSAWAKRIGYLTMEEDPEVSGGLLVYAKQDKIVTYNGPKTADTGDNAGNWLDPSAASTVWDNSSYPDGEFLYYINTGYAVAFKENVPVFPGKRLLNRGEIRLSDSASYYVTNFYFYPTGSTPAIYVRQKDTHLGGNLTTMGEGTREIWQIDSRSFYLDSTLHGTGGLVFNSYYPDGEGSPFYLTADNSDWTGTLQLKWTDRDAGNYPSSESRHTRIVVGDAKSLGGNPAAFTHDLILLDDYAEIRFTNTTVQTVSNRGLCVTNGILRVDEGATAALAAPVTLAGTLRKVGAGTLALDGGIRYAANNDLTDTAAPEADKNIVLVQEGAIKGSSLALAAVIFSNDTGIAADTASGAMDLTGATVTVEGTIYLKADGNTLPEPTQNVTYPVVKVLAAQAAELGDKLKAARSPWRGWPVTLVSETDADGNVTYSVKYEKKGFVISIR